MQVSLTGKVTPYVAMQTCILFPSVEFSFRALDWLTLEQDVGAIFMDTVVYKGVDS